MPRNPRYLSIPTLLFALVFAHVVHFICEPLALNNFMCTILYLATLILPIGLKRAFTPAPEMNDDPFNTGPLSRFPTSRFQTQPRDGHINYE